MFKRIYVDNFRCLVNFEFRPDRVNLLVGANGSGKSTFLDALNLLMRLTEGLPVATMLPQGTLPWWDRRLVQTFIVEVVDPVSGELFEYRLLVQHPGNAEAAQLTEESLTCDRQSVFSLKNKSVSISVNGSAIDLPINTGHTFLSTGLGASAKAVRFRDLISRFRLFKINPWNISSNSTVENFQLWNDGSNFVSWLRYLLQDSPDAYMKWRQLFTVSLPQFRGARLLDLGGGARLLQGLLMKPGVEDVGIPFYDFSEGERCLSVLLAIAVRRDRVSVLALDEPDNFLSIREVQPVLKELIEPMGGKEPQLFIVTHHPEVIDYLAADSTWMFERTNEQVRVRRLTFDRESGERASETVKAELQ
jgi:predicted ATPase